MTTITSQTIIIKNQVPCSNPDCNIMVIKTNQNRKKYCKPECAQFVRNKTKIKLFKNKRQYVIRFKELYHLIGEHISLAQKRAKFELENPLIEPLESNPENVELVKRNLYNRKFDICSLTFI